MTTITRCEHPASVAAPEMFVLHAERDLWDDVLLDTVGDLDMSETVELLFSHGMHPHYYRQVRLVASNAASPTCEADVLGLATVSLPMADNPQLAEISVVVRRGSRCGGIGSALHTAALEVARECRRSTIQTWTCEPLTVPDGALELRAESGNGSVAAESPESRFLRDRGYVLGQFERLSRLHLPHTRELASQRDSAADRAPEGYEVITIHGPTPEEFLDDAAVLCAAMAADAPTGAMTLEPEVWDVRRVRAANSRLEAAQRDQMQTFARHAGSGSLVGFTRLVRDRAVPGVAHQWETLVLGEHRGHGLGMLMKVVNHAALSKYWPEATRLITGNASENVHMLAINTALGYQPFAAEGFWELRRGTER